MKRYRKPYRIKKKKSILKSRLFWRVVLGLVFAGVSFYFFLFSPIFRIKKINISGNEDILTQDIKKIITDEMFAEYGDNVFLFGSLKIKNTLLGIYPKISKLELRRIFPDTLRVAIEERKSVAIFSQGDELFSLDKEGIIFENASDKLGLITVRSNSTELKDIGGKVLEDNIISSILTIGSKLKDDFKIAIEEVLAASNERLNIKTDEGWEIYFDPTQDLNWQITKLKAVLEQEISPDRRKSLQYIELRFGNLASYK
ncbi:MAG: FtsQ-type POTRA domain-containing protein [bacterium]|nr:FtsQ-type POTRA domain-containing protein [bacterium]